MQAAAQVVDPNARVWCGDGELEVQGLRVLGIPIGTPAFVRSELRKKSVLHSVLLDRIPVVQDLQSAWLLLLYCANTRANYWLRGVPPEDVAQFASDHDVATQSCLSQLLGAGLTQDAQDLASLPLSLGGCGLRSASRSKEAAHWASWADSLRMIHQRHPDVAALMVRALSSAEEGRHLQAAESCRLQLLSLGGFVPPEWHAAAEARPRFLANVDLNEPGVPARGWQFEASASVENFFFLHSIVPCSSPAQCALLRSQGGPFSGLPFTVFPTSIHQRFASVLFRVLLFRRLRLPLPLSSRTCRCGRPLDVLGHHRAACSTSGVLGRRGFALESAAARICREAGARVSTNIFVRDLDLAPLGGVDGRRLEVVAEGLPVFHGAQLAIDTTLVSPLRADGVPHRQCATSDGAALQAAREDVPRTLWNTRARQTCRFSCRGGWQMVRGNALLHQSPCPRQGPVTAQDHPCSRPSVLALPLGVHSLLCCRESSGIFAPREPRESWHGWPDTINVRRHVRLASHARRGGVICLLSFDLHIFL